MPISYLVNDHLLTVVLLDLLLWLLLQFQLLTLDVGLDRQLQLLILSFQPFELRFHLHILFLVLFVENRENVLLD